MVLVYPSNYPAHFHASCHENPKRRDVQSHCKKGKEHHEFDTQAVTQELWKPGRPGD